MWCLEPKSDGFPDISVQSTSEVGSAGLYLEDYFEEQLKQVYPDRLFPGGRADQMIPPLEDEIDEEEEGMPEGGMAPIEDDKPQSPAGEGMPPVEEDLPPPDESTAPVEEKPQTEEKAIDTRDHEDKKEAVFAGISPPAETKEDEQEMKCSTAAESDSKDGDAPVSPKKEDPQLPTDKTEADPPETENEEPAPGDKAKDEAEEG